MDKRIISILNDQAKDDGLWFIPKTVGEGYLQQALSELHKVIADCVPVSTTKVNFDDVFMKFDQGDFMKTNIKSKVQPGISFEHTGGNTYKVVEDKP